MSLPQRLTLATLILTAGLAGAFVAGRWGRFHPGHPHAGLHLPQRIPDITLPGLDGRRHALSQWKGHPLFINFWATWCGPCRQEIPVLRKLRAEHAAEGLEIIGVAIDFRDAVADYAREAGIEYPILIAEQDATVQQAFGLGSEVPTTLIVARDGRIVDFKLGQIREPRGEELVRRALETP